MTPTPTWGTPQPPPAPVQAPQKRNVLALAVAALVVVLVAVAVGVVVHRNNPPPPSGTLAAPSPVASTIEPTRAPDFVPPSGLVPSPGATLPGTVTTTGPDQTVPTQAPNTALPTAPSSGQASPEETGAPPQTDPVAATRAYYGALAMHRSAAAFAMLCGERQAAEGMENYIHSYDDDIASGTGITTWTVDKPVQVSGSEAAVPGVLMLDDGESVPITVLLLNEDGGWRVCSSNLGGVLPNPGGGPGSGGTVTT